MSSGELVATVRGVSRAYGTGDDAVPVLAPTDLDLHGGTIAVLAGPSGSGKTTLCHLLLGWDVPTTGRIELHPAGGSGAPSSPTAPVSWAQRSCAPQRLALVEHLSVLENLLLPTWTGQLAGRSPTLDELSELLDVAHLRARRPSELSFGEQQRVAVARALLGAPRLVVLDEPTGHQDEEHAGSVLDALRAARAAGSCVLVSTHDPALLAVADQITRLSAPEPVTRP